MYHRNWWRKTSSVNNQSRNVRNKRPDVSTLEKQLLGQKWHPLKWAEKGQLNCHKAETKCNSYPKASWMGKTRLGSQAIERIHGAENAEWDECLSIINYTIDLSVPKNTTKATVVRKVNGNVYKLLHVPPKGPWQSFHGWSKPLVNDMSQLNRLVN